MTARNTALKSRRDRTIACDPVPGRRDIGMTAANAPAGSAALAPVQERRSGRPRPTRPNPASRRHQGLPHDTLSRAHTPRPSPTTTTSRRHGAA